MSWAVITETVAGASSTGVSVRVAVTVTASTWVAATSAAKAAPDRAKAETAPIRTERWNMDTPRVMQLRVIRINWTRA